MTDRKISELGDEEMKDYYNYKNDNKSHYNHGFLLGYKKAQSDLGVVIPEGAFYCSHKDNYKGKKCDAQCTGCRCAYSE